MSGSCAPARGPTAAASPDELDARTLLVPAGAPDLDLADSKSESVADPDGHKRKLVAWNVYAEADLFAPPRSPLDDPENPMTWGARRALLLALVILSALVATTCSSAAALSYGHVEHKFHVGQEVAILTVALFVLGFGLGPAIFSPLSEFYGRRPIYLVSLGSFVLLNFPVAFANNIAVLIIFRFLSAFAASAFLSVAGATCTDLYPREQLFIPMSFFTVGPFLGPIVGPLYSGFANQFTHGFRWTYFPIIIWSFMLVVGLAVFYKETYHPLILTRRAQRLRVETGDPSWVSQMELDLGTKNKTKVVLQFMWRIPILLSTEIMLTLFCFWSALLLGIVYLLFEALPFTMQTKHHFNEWQSGLSFTGILVGEAMAVASIPYWNKRYQQALKRYNGSPPPEERLFPSMLGSFLTVIGLLVFGLTTFRSVHWVAPIISIMPFGTGVILCFMSIFSYTGEAWRPVASSAMACNACVRCIFSTAMPLFAIPMFKRMQPVGGSLFLAGLNVLMIPIPFVLYRLGARIRANSRYCAS